MTSEAAGGRERTARLALLALVVVAPLVYLPRVLFGEPTELPAATPPAWTHLVVVTVGGWPGLAQSLDDEDLAAFDRRASRVAAVFAPSASRAASAASLWTGRYPRSHGVMNDGLALGEGVWTLAEAARAAGTTTAAFLTEPFVTRSGIGGFETVREAEPEAWSALVDEAAALLEESVGERVLIWVHLADAGPDSGVSVGDALARLTAALEASDRAPETAVALALLARGLGPDAPPPTTIDPLGGPLWVALPGALNVGRRGDARLSLVDVPGTLLLLLGLRPPAEAPLSSRGDVLWNALRGGGGAPGVVVQGERDVWRRGDERVVLDAAGTARAERRVDRAWTALGGEEAQRLLAEARRVAEEITAIRTAPRPAGPR
ncbi:MAG: hypothetical protein AAF682_23330 [Planctomycetota bacterium]